MSAFDVGYKIPYVIDLIENYSREFKGKPIGPLTDHEIARMLKKLVRKKAPKNLFQMYDVMGHGYMDDMDLVNNIQDGTADDDDIISGLSEQPSLMSGIDLMPLVYEGEECSLDPDDYWNDRFTGKSDADPSDIEEWGWLYNDLNAVIFNLVCNDNWTTATGYMPLAPLIAATLNPLNYYDDGYDFNTILSSQLLCMIEINFDMVDNNKYPWYENPFLGQFERNYGSVQTCSYDWSAMDKLKQVVAFTADVNENQPSENQYTDPDWLIGSVVRDLWLSPDVRRKLEAKNAKRSN